MTKIKKSVRSWLIKHPGFHPVLIFRPGLWRVVTGPIRVLPDFIIIGAGKSGTSSLYNYLIQHPNIYSAKIKEINYFVRGWTKWYRPNFPTIFQKFYVTKIKKEPFITGEATPFYLIHPHVPKKVYDKIPNVKIIILLRDPVDRSFSQFNQWKKTKYENFSFEEAVKSEKIKTSDEWLNYTDEEFPGSRINVKYSYIEGGLYFEQIKRWLDIFPKNQILILKAEDFFSNPAKITSRVFDFLGISPYEIDGTKKFNVGQYDHIEPEIEEFLRKFFKPYNKKLFELIREEFHWK